jgi:hypothetical protein
METPGGNLFIPNRSVEVANKRPISRNTNYMLSYEEAELIKEDDRVWDIVPQSLIDLQQIKPYGYKIENANFSKDTAPNVAHTQWGFVTHSDDTPRPNWSSTNQSSLTSVTELTITASGKNVDVLIVDGHIDPAHPEFATIGTETDYSDGALVSDSSNGAVFDRSITVRGVKCVIAGAVGGQTAVPDAWAYKTAKFITLLINPQDPLINLELQANLIKTLKGDSGTTHAGLPTAQRVAWGGGASYTPNFLTDTGAAQYAGYQDFLDNNAVDDMVWYRNTSGPNPPTSNRDIEELAEHLFHTIHNFGIPGAVPGSATEVPMQSLGPILEGNPSFDWQNTELHLAMKEAIDANLYDPSGYSTDWATDSDAAMVAYKEYTYLVNWSMWDMSTFWDGGSLSPEWSDTLKTPAGMLANNPLGHAMFKKYFEPVLSKPDFAVLRDIFRDNDLGPSYYTPAANGAPRIKQINWFDYAESGDPRAGGTYTYTPYSQASDIAGQGLSGDNNHGAHCGGTVAGNTQGWARDSNIYNISPYGSNPNGSISSTMWDYIRNWHKNKPINPKTGRRNPTVSNHSYGSTLEHVRDGYGSIPFPYDITYRGVNLGVGSSNELTPAQLEARGINCSQKTIDTTGNGVPDTVVDVCETPAYFTDRFADIEDAINEGIIICYAAGNENNLITKAGDVDYNNRHQFMYLGFINYDLPYHRGGSSGQGVDNTIVVGCVDNYMLPSGEHRKTSYSNWGSAVDIYAAGDWIQSAVDNTDKTSLATVNDARGGTDPRGFTYGQSKYPGTSMASPQVCGVLTLLAESWPGMTQAEAQNWVRENALVDLLYESGTIDPTQSYNLGSGDNLMLFWKNQRKETGNVYPLKTAGRREKSSIKYPRPRIRRRG